MNEIPTPNEGPDEADERYRRLSGRDSSGPSEAVRRAVLRHAAELAAQTRTGAPSSVADRRAAPAKRRRVATYGGLAAAAVLAGLLTVPHFLLRSTEPARRVSPGRTALESQMSAPKTAAPPVAQAANAPPPQAMQELVQDSAARPTASAPQPLRSPAAAPSARANALPPAASLADPPATLRAAAQRGDVSALRGLLARKPDINGRDASGRTALMLAVLQGHREAVDTLLAAGADPNAADLSGRTPLQAALADAHSAAIATALEQWGAR